AVAERRRSRNVVTVTVAGLVSHFLPRSRFYPIQTSMLEQHYHLEHSIHSLARYELQPIYRMLALLHSLGSPTSTNLRLAPVGDTNGKLRSRATFRCLLIDGLCVHANYPSRSPIWNSQLHIHTRTPGFLRPAQQRPHAG